MEIKKETVTAGVSPTGARVDIVKHEINADKDGPTLYIQGGIHGGEVTQWIVHDLFSYLKENLKRGRVILIPAANPVAWLQRLYFSTAGKFDLYMGKDFNRNFPGNADGGMAERVAATLVKMTKGADFALDLHTSRSSMPFGIYSGKDDISYVKIIAMPYNQRIDDLAGTFNFAMQQAGIANMCIECGSHDSYEAKNIRAVLDGIKRLLKSMDMTDDAPASGQVETFGKTVSYRAKNGGMIRMMKNPGEYVSEGEDLYTHYDALELGKITTEKSRHDGIILKISPTHIYWSGDDITQIIPKSEISYL